MIKNLSAILLPFIVTFFTVTAADASAAVQPVLPLDSSVIGAEFSYRLEKITPYAAVGYDYDTNEILYRLGSRSSIGEFGVDLNYGYWVNRELAGYYYQRGFEGNLAYYGAPEETVRLKIFSGTVGRNEAEAVDADYLGLGYYRELYFDWDKEIDFELKVTAGRARGETETFYLSASRLPMRFGETIILPRFGYARWTELLRPGFAMGNAVRGYDDPEENRGDRLIALTVERRFELFPYSDLPFVNLLHLSVFGDAGDILKPGEEISSLRLHSCLGTGLLLDLGGSEFRYEWVVTDRGDWRNLFYSTFSY